MVKKKVGRRAAASDASADDAAAKRRRGGRKPGEWKLITPEQLKDYRSEHKISRARLAQMLGVSSTSVQNWETGTVASMRIQQRLSELIAAGPTAILPPRKPASLWDMAAKQQTDPAITTTGTIVAGYLQTREGKLSTEDLIGLIRSVRQALS
ncbi:MAG: helix-turn-helix domain-containing protein [Planctomycetes bacterium]|nr:helix-turn-helix domain-containing protein [Planctomycetota bacterium]